MAVLDKYVTSKLQAGKLENPAIFSGAQTFGVVTTFEVAAADDNGSVFRVANVNSNAILLSAVIFNDAIAAATDYELGIYVAGVGGAVLDKDAYQAGLDINAGLTGTSLMGTIAAENRVKRVYELAGHTVANKHDRYDLALTADTVGTAAGTITVVLVFIQG